MRSRTKYLVLSGGNGWKHKTRKTIERADNKSSAAPSSISAPTEADINFHEQYDDGLVLDGNDSIELPRYVLSYNTLHPLPHLSNPTLNCRVTTLSLPIAEIIANTTILRDQQAFSIVPVGNKVFCVMKDVRASTVIEKITVVTFGLVEMGGVLSLLSGCSCHLDSIRSLLKSSTTYPITLSDFGSSEMQEIQKCSHTTIAAYLLTEQFIPINKAALIKNFIQSYTNSANSTTNQNLTHFRVPQMSINSFVHRTKVQLPVYLVMTNCDVMVVPATLDGESHLRCLICSRSTGKFCSHTNHLRKEIMPVENNDSHPRFESQSGVPPWKSVSKGNEGMI